VVLIVSPDHRVVPPSPVPSRSWRGVGFQTIEDGSVADLTYHADRLRPGRRRSTGPRDFVNVSVAHFDHGLQMVQSLRAGRGIPVGDAAPDWVRRAALSAGAFAYMAANREDPTGTRGAAAPGSPQSALRRGEEMTPRSE